MTDAADYKLLICVVPRGRGDDAAAITRSAGASGGTILYGKGTACNRWLEMLCLADTEKELVFTLAPAKGMPAIIAALRQAPGLCRRTPGVGFVVDAGFFWRQGLNEQARESGEKEIMETTHQLICVIANAGFAYDIMGAARRAGARGGTVLKARGTGSEEDGSFFGITIVPEKDLIMILSLREETAAITKAIRQCPCMAEPGFGIMFCLPAGEFFPLGAKANGAG